ncbi:MAG: hypothetical protein JETCAE03_34370 [Ignavibacteriaceae bacterium]|jgi:nucleoside 2-deoxyribosyltransferase|nr:MAG: hypothetical protein JETCAE03_34370 [Ignavibacteriaceae bacterium]
MNYKIYLAGPITGLTWSEATEWRKELTNRFADESIINTNKYQCLSPLRDKEYLSEEQNIKHSYEEHQLSTAKMINSRDMFDVRRSDLLIVNLKNAKKVSIGTVLEIGAAYILNKPIITVMEEDNIHRHSMLNEQSTVIVSDIDTAFYFALQILG